MRTKPRPISLLMLTIGLSGGSLSKNAAAPPETNLPPPLTRAHAHNDYEHPRPLFDGLDHGFCSIEADVWLVDDHLLVAHDREKVKATRTLQALYLNPLRERVRKNRGRVYPNGPEVILLVDVKSDAEKTYAALRQVMPEYADMVTVFRDGNVQTTAVKTVT